MAELSSQSDRLEDLRRRVDEIDLQLLRLLNERASIVVDIGKVKRDEQSPIYAPSREQAVLAKVREANEGPLSDRCLEAIFRELMSGSFSLEQSLHIGYLGPPGSFSHLSASRQFGASVEYAALESIPNVFRAVEGGQVDFGLVPIENSTGGAVKDTLDSFLQTTVRVCAEVLVAVHHHLLSHASAAEIRKVYSRPEVFDQCRQWLSTHLQQAERVPVESSARAAAIAAEEPGAAAISSSLAAELYNLPTVDADIEDNPNNVTRFFVVGRHDAKPTGDDKTAILFTTAHKPGALAAVLDIFRDAGINLTHIDKRPSQRVNWEYFFFIDCEGHAAEPKLARALQAAADHCLHLHVLGSFPRAKSVLE